MSVLGSKDGQGHPFASLAEPLYHRTVKGHVSNETLSLRRKFTPHAGKDTRLKKKVIVTPVFQKINKIYIHTVLGVFI